MGSQISFSTATSGICQDSPADKYTRQNLLKQFSAELETEAEVFLSLLIKLVSGETEAGEVRRGWMRVLAMAMEIMRGASPSYLAPGTVILRQLNAGSVVTPSSCTVSGSATMLRPLIVTPESPLAHASSLFVATLQRLITSRPSLLSVSAQMLGVGVPASDSLLYWHSHSLDSVTEMVATAASATVSNVVGMMGTEAGLSMQTAVMKVQWCRWCVLLSQSGPHPMSFC
jgi:hypothetical protein